MPHLPPEPQPGNEFPPARWFEDLASELRRQDKLTVMPPLMLTKTAFGKTITLADIKPIKVALSGSSSPYSWTEVRRSGASTASFPGARTGSGNAYELNATANLSGQVVDIHLNGDGTYDFQIVPLCGPPPPPCTTKPNKLCVMWSGCTGDTAGLPFTITLGGSTIASGTALTTGYTCVSVTQIGTFTIHIDTTGTRYDTPGDQTITLTSCGGTYSFPFQLRASAAYFCHCCQGPPIPQTLTLTDKYGTHSLVYNAILSAWACCFTAPDSIYRWQTCTPSPYFFVPPQILVPDTGNVQVSYLLTCGDTAHPGQWTLVKEVFGNVETVLSCNVSDKGCFAYIGVDPSAPCYGSGGSVGHAPASGYCSPISATFSIPNPTTEFGCTMGGYSDTVTISE